MEKEVLEFQLNRGTTELYKAFLEILEDVKSVHQDSINNLRRALAFNEKRLKKRHDIELYLEPIALQAHFFDDEFFEKLRKRILDKGNDCLRKQAEELEKYNIKVKG